MLTTQCLTALNSGDPNRVHDAMRKLSLGAFGVTTTQGIGNLLNALTAKANQGTASVAAFQTVTIAGVPTTGDVITAATNANAVSYTLLVADAVSATTAATAVTNALNANPTFAAAYRTTSALGVVTITALRKGTGQNTTTQTSGVVGVCTATSGGATLAGGTGLDDLLSIVDTGV